MALELELRGGQKATQLGLGLGRKKLLLRWALLWELQKEHSRRSPGL